jgi:hypothetical protein
MEHIRIGIFSCNMELKIYKHYIFGRKIIVWTDHSVLTSLKTKRDKITRKLGGWALKLQEYYIDIQHQPGKMHTNTDVLFRMEANSTLYYIETETNIMKELTTCKRPPQLQNLLEQTRTKHPHEKYQRAFHNRDYLSYISQESYRMDQQYYCYEKQENTNCPERKSNTGRNIQILGTTDITK